MELCDCRIMPEDGFKRENSNATILPDDFKPVNERAHQKFRLQFSSICPQHFSIKQHKTTKNTKAQKQQQQQTHTQ